MHRRKFLLASGAVGAGLALAPVRGLSAARAANAAKFTLNYAPHFGMFRHSAGADLVDQLQFAAGHGFRAWEDTGMKSRAVKRPLALVRFAPTVTSPTWMKTFMSG